MSRMAKPAKAEHPDAGDDGSLEKTIETALQWAHRHLPRHARRRVDTGDLVQESLVNVLRNLGELEKIDPETLRRYLITAIRNRICDEVRRARLGEVTNGGSPSYPDPRPSPHDEAVESEYHRKFRQALLKLDESDQMLMVGRVELQLSYEELALATGKPSPDAARNAARRAALRLAALMR